MKIPLFKANCPSSVTEGVDTYGSTEERRMPIAIFFTSRGAYVNVRYIAMLYTHSIGNQP